MRSSTPGWIHTFRVSLRRPTPKQAMSKPWSNTHAHRHCHRSRWLWFEGRALTHLRAAGYEVVDFGAHRLDPSDDYPDFVIPLARAVVAGEVERGVAICGSGVGASVCANKVPGARASLIHDHFSAK